MTAALDKLASRSVTQPPPEYAEGDCTVWTGAVETRGHGVIRWAGAKWKVHRLAWTERHGPIPEGMQVLHRCDVPACWTDAHTYIGTNADNVRDRTERKRHWANKRTHCINRHELTEANTVVRRDGFRRCRLCHADCSRRLLAPSARCSCCGSQDHRVMWDRAPQPTPREDPHMTTTFWAAIDHQIEALRTAGSAADVIRILGGSECASSGDAFFAGSGGDDTVFESLMAAGWRTVWYAADYYWAAQAPDGSGITYVEGDVYNEIQKRV